MPKGRPRKPTKVLQLQGTYQPCRHDSRDEPPLEPLTELPPAPGILGEVGQYEWYRIGPELVRLGVVAHADLATFASYCMAVDTIAVHTKILNADGPIYCDERGHPKLHPSERARLQAINTERLLANELGITPAARSKVKAGDPPKKPKADPWDAVGL